MKPRSARLSLQALDGRELPSAPAPVAPPTSPTYTAAAATSAAPASPDTVRHYAHIRVAMLAYTGTPIGDLEKKLLRDSVDLVLPAVGLLGKIDPLAPTTPQIIYTNVSNIYLELLTDWLDYADRRGF